MDTHFINAFLKINTSVFDIKFPVNFIPLQNFEICKNNSGNGDILKNC